MSETQPASRQSTPRKRFSPLRLLFWTVALTGILPYLFAREVMNPSIAAAVIAHVTGGGLLGLVLLSRSARARVMSSEAPPSKGFAPLLLAAGVTGAMLLFVALMGQSIGSWRGTYMAHAAAGLIVAAISAASMAGPLLNLWSRGKAHALSAALTVLLSAGALAGTQYAAEVYFAELTAVTAAQARNPLFPAAARIERPAEWAGAPSPQSCGETGCHPEIVRQWSESAHARAVENPGYQASLAHARGRLGQDGVRWCAGCHAPLSLIRNAGQPAAIHDSKSVECLSCHAMSRVPGPMGNGHAAYSPPSVYPFADAARPGSGWLHGFLLRVRPAPHRASLNGPAPEQPRSAMCAPCHRLSVNVPQNGYKFLRFDETWSDWQASGYSGESAHAFAEPPIRADCVDCHFPRAQRPRGGRTLPYHGGILPKGNSPAASSPIRVEVFAMRRESGTGGLPRFDAPLARTPVVLAAGQVVAVDVLVENRGVGHSYPSAFLISRRAWLDVTVTDSRGRAVAAERSPNRPGAPERHAYGLTALDRSGNPVNANDFYAMVAPISLRNLPAGEGEVVRYRFKVPRVPANRGGSLRITARLLSPAGPPGAEGSNTECSAEHAVSLPLADAGRALLTMPARSSSSDDAPRFFAYGIALLRPGAGPEELAESRAAFREAIRLQPGNADYVTALGRAYLAEGDLLSARAQMEQALRIDARSPRAKAWLGTILLRMGQLEAALDVLNPLAREYPRDRLLWLDIGLSYLKSARYQPAADAFNQALDIDPSDAAAHYNLMRCYTALNRLTDARREESVFRALQDDEPLTALVEPYLQAHPVVRRESLPMHIHTLETPR